MKQYIPNPIDTSDIELPEELLSLTEQIARNVHEVWAQARISQGWQWGELRNDTLKLHPCLVSYDDMPEEDKEYDRKTTLETLKMIQTLGFGVIKYPL